MRGDKNFRHGCRLHPAQLRGNRGEIAFGNDNKLGLCSSGSESENAVADFPALRCLAQRFHFAGEFEAGNVFGIAGWRRIMTAALQNIARFKPAACTRTRTRSPVGRAGISTSCNSIPSTPPGEAITTARILALRIVCCARQV